MASASIGYDHPIHTHTHRVKSPFNALVPAYSRLIESPLLAQAKRDVSQYSMLSP
jgi:hypothetical protein